ncbi:phage DNA ejection protein [Enterobacter hormaechei]|uniref:phage DNA ejection protein n=1 Tax=Enterobacter hormaechei TaxID=158836 RepID=UPI00298B8C34|nr:phage DNA ejection protein [Enterobacter hormaechei]HBL5177878.1 phage DNA ejection protein [Enterobacter hormaechei]HBL6016948.1 phage DNA ejection protein [Enterobacter hormaechei]HBL6131256.1 phage DNA ejection protein [Enterobacter hormaechei]HBL8998209.1 phage DNA ejection protein [Enterobacter hormaechei]
MATWQQSGNPGGLLAGLGGVNTNAPQASDANTALAFIRQNNEDIRSGRNNVGLQALQGIGSVMDMYKQQESAQRQQEFQKLYGQAYASGDRNAMRQLAAQYPDQVDAVRNGMKFVDEDQRNTVGNLAAAARLAATSPEAMGAWLQKNAADLQRVGLDPAEVAQTYQQNPQQFGEFVDHLGMAALGPVDYFNAQDKIVGQALDRDKLNETIRSNQAGESLQRRGQDITARGQDISAATARRGQDMANQRAKTSGNAGGDGRTVQLSDGRTVQIVGKLHGAGQNAFYEGVDNVGNTVRVPASSIAAPATSAASAQNYAMSKDLNAILNAPTEKLDFMTGVTGGNGSPSWDAEVRSRLGGGEQRQLFNATKRIQGKMQNQGIAAARDMGASGINTVAEAKMYFQGMPQVDYSSPEAMQQSLRDIQQYTDNYNQQYSVDVGNRSAQSKPSRPAQQSQPAQQPQQSTGFSSLWGD